MSNPTMKTIRKVMPIGPDRMMSTMNPFVFGVFHDDKFPQGDGKLGVKGGIPSHHREFGNGRVNWKSYHSRTNVPGFPGHPHCGFETVTIVPMGMVDHADSLGACGRYGNGDVQWLTTGRGVMHAEMFPLVNADTTNHMELFQLWLRLPSSHMKVDPAYTMLWNEDIPDIVKQNEEGRTTRVRLIAGSLGDIVPPSPPKDSWAVNGGDVRIMLIDLDGGASFKIPPAVNPDRAASTIWLYNDEAPSEITLNGSEKLSRSSGAHVLIPPEGLTLHNPGTSKARLLFLEGNPIDEPYVHRGPFVAKDQDGLRKSIEEYQRTEYGGWPWPEIGPTFGDKPRFSRYPDGTEEFKER